MRSACESVQIACSLALHRADVHLLPAAPLTLACFKPLYRYVPCCHRSHQDSDEQQVYRGPQLDLRHACQNGVSAELKAGFQRLTLVCA